MNIFKVTMIIFTLICLGLVFVNCSSDDSTSPTPANNDSRVIKGTVPAGSGVTKVIAETPKKQQYTAVPGADGSWTLTLPKKTNYALFMEKPTTKAPGQQFILAKLRPGASFYAIPKSPISKGTTAGNLVPVILNPDGANGGENDFYMSSNESGGNDDIDLGDMSLDETQYDTIDCGNNPMDELDADGDGTDDLADTDDDGDGTLDEVDQDDDGDGVVDDWSWLDEDNDGIYDWDDNDVPGADMTDMDSDGYPDDWDWDLDGDGSENDDDTDDDGDGTLDTSDLDYWEDQDVLDQDDDGIPDEWDDDINGDGELNDVDTDDDGDGVSDQDEATNGTDPNDADSDNDGFNDLDDTADNDPLTH